MTKTVTLEESFTDLDDAELWLQGVLIDHAYMEVVEGTCIRYVNHQWQVYVVLED